MHATSDTSDNSLDEARLRAADYRMRAEELRMRAELIDWADIRAGLPRWRIPTMSLRRPLRTSQRSRRSRHELPPVDLWQLRRASVQRLVGTRLDHDFLQVADRFNALAVSIEQIAGERPSSLLEWRK